MPKPRMVALIEKMRGIANAGAEDAGKTLIWDDATRQLKLTDAPVSSGGSGFVFNEVPTGVMDGVNTVFTIGNPLQEGSERIHLNGMRQTRDADYTITGTQVTFTAPPVSTDSILVDYVKA